jgi:hypothetical protein
MGNLHVRFLRGLGASNGDRLLDQVQISGEKLTRQPLPALDNECVTSLDILIGILGWQEIFRWRHHGV